MMNRRQFLTTAAVVALALPSISRAGGGGGLDGGATEITQIANNGELVEQVAQSAEQTAELITQGTTMINQYTTMLQNLERFPLAVIGKAIGGLQIPSEAQKILRTYAAVQKLASAASRASGVLQRAGGVMDMMKIDPKQYLQQLQATAASRASGFGNLAQEEFQTLQNYQQTAQDFADHVNTIGDIDGNVKGLQHLATTAAMSAQEMRELNAKISQFQGVQYQQMQIQEQEKVDQKKLFELHLDDLKKATAPATTDTAE